MNIIQGGKAFDDRGAVSFVNDFDPEDLGIKRFYMVENHHAGFIRAWHGHMEEEKYVLVVQGAALVCAFDMVDDDVEEEDVGRFVLTAEKPQILHIPAGHANGFKTLTSDTKVMFFSTSTLKESLSDDTRFDWDHFGESFWEDNYR